MMAYTSLATAWPRRDPAAINRSLATLCDMIPNLAGSGVYMSLSQRKVETFYHRMNAFTWGWGIYVVALALSIWAVVTGWRFARGMAFTVFSAAFVLHGIGLGLRWYIIGRIPVANMFESVVASAWLGAAIAMGLELRVLRAWQSIYLIPLFGAVILEQTFKSPLWYVAAGLAAAGLLADMTYTRLRRRPSADSAMQHRGVFILAACFLGFLSLALGNMVGSEITTIAGILDDVLLRIHTVMIITSYALVTLAFGVANCYLVVRAWKHHTSAARVTLGCELGMVAGLYPMLANKFDVAQGLMISMIVGATIAGAIVAWALPMIFSRSARLAMHSGPMTASLMSSTYAAPAPPHRLKNPVGPVHSPVLGGLDLSQMTLMNMANIGLFVGMILGAVWADYSWGRPWGWDPKEVFALTTWLIYAILIHVRYVTRDKALWSSVVAVIGFAMMMFNWWAVNFFVVGLHSYA